MYRPSNLGKVLWEIKGEGDPFPAFTGGKLNSFQYHLNSIPHASPTCQPWAADWWGFHQWVPVVSQLWLGSANGLSWQEIRGREEKEVRVFMTLETSLWSNLKLAVSKSLGSSQGGSLSTTLSSGNHFLPVSLQWWPNPLPSQIINLDNGYGSSLWCPDPCNKFIANDPSVCAPSA